MPQMIHGQEYTTVAERIDALHHRMKMETIIGSDIKTEILSVETHPKTGLRMLVMKATVNLRTKDGLVHTFEGHAEERETPYDPAKRRQDVNWTSFVENAETSAIGRALKNGGFSSSSPVASAEEMKNVQKQQDEAEVHAKAMNEAFAAYDKASPKLEEMGLSKDVFWKEFSRHQKVSSRESVSIQEWNQLKKDLDPAAFADWIVEASSRLEAEAEKQRQKDEAEDYNERLQTENLSDDLQRRMELDTP